MTKFEASKAKEQKEKYFMSQEDKIRRGQSYNLAVAAAISDGKPLDKEKIFSYFTFYYDLGKLCQTYSLDEIRELLK